MKKKIIKWLCKKYNLVEFKEISRMLDQLDAYAKKSPSPEIRKFAFDMFWSYVNSKNK